MKNGLSGHALNELDLLWYQAKEREKASNNLIKFKQIESERKAVRTYTIINGFVTVFEAKKKTKKNK